MNISKADHDKLLQEIEVSKAALSAADARRMACADRADELDDALQKVWNAAMGRPAVLSQGSPNTYGMSVGLSSEGRKKLSRAERAEMREDGLNEHIITLEKRLMAVQTIIECSGLI